MSDGDEKPGDAETPTPEERLIARRRLLLVKQLYQHALGHAEIPGAINKMIAVHNFHNAIEITLRAVLLEHGVRPEKELNIDFESMLNEVPKVKGKGVPLRQQLRTLNQKRNHVQHAASEPPDSDMAEWKAFTANFLSIAFTRYFDVDFATVSAVGLVEDPRLRTLLEHSARHLHAGEAKEAACSQKLTMYHATRALLSTLGRRRHFWTMGVPKELADAMKTTKEWLDDVEENSVLLASGVSLASLARFRRVKVIVMMTIVGRPVFQAAPGTSDNLDLDELRWCHEFVVDAVIRWQVSGLEPQVLPHFRAGHDAYMNEVYPPKVE
jgi:hypothetical protein